MTNSAFPTFDGANRSAAEPSLEFGRFRVLLRQRKLLVEGVPIELGTRAFELLLALLEADGSIVSKEQLLSRIWPGIAVAEDNLKMHVFALRRALGEDRNYIRTEFGRGYRFIAAVRSTVPWGSHRCPSRQLHRSTRGLFPRRTSLPPLQGWSVDCLGRHFDLARGAAAASCRDQTALDRDP
jgi:DNA-binding winged helix-turn-helix (wHTH) protein